MSRKISLRNQAIIFAIALGTLPVMATGIIAYAIVNSSMQHSMIRYQKARAIGISNRIRQVMVERVSDIKALSGLGVLNDEKLISETSYLQRQAVLDRFQEAYGVYQSIVVTDLTGKVVLQTQNSSETQIEIDRYVSQGDRSSKITIQPKEQRGEYEIIVAAFFNSVNTSQVKGVVLTTMPVKDLTAEINVVTERLAEGTDNFESEQYHVIDGQGQIFISNNRDTLGQTIYELVPNFDQLSQSNQTISQTMLNPQTKKENLITYIPISSISGISELSWGAIVSNNTAEVFATGKQLFWMLSAVTIVTAAIVSVIATVFANAATRSLSKISNSILQSAIEIASTMEQQERIISQQAMAVNQTTSTMNELNNSAQQSAQQAGGSAHGSRQALNLTEEGTQAVKHTLDGMNILKEKVGAIAQQIMRLSQQTNQIGNISIIVADLANQTNMLALNASVEAVRAGEHGKGFGVVASEIRKLADQSKKSADRINTLVADIQNAIDLTVMVTDEGTKTVDEGVKIAQDTEQVFSGVTNAINDIVLGTQQISLNAEQQVTAIQQVVDAMNILNSSAQENVQGITQVKTRTQELNQAAQDLQDVV